MKRIHTLLLSATVAAGSFLNAVALTGSWRGELSLGMMKLPLVFNFSESPEGKVSCTLDSPNQGAKGIPAEVALCSADSVAVDCTLIGATYRGRVSASQISGTFSQSGQSFPLTLAPDEDLSVRRPQTPVPPFPYLVKDTVFTSADGTLLSGTLVMPEKRDDRPLTGVVFVSGSGAQNRDEELFEHRPFAVMADRLAREGIASFRYDDRGTASSQGDFSSSTTFTFRDDASAALRFLHGIEGIGKAGIVGHSEGGTIAFMLAADGEPDFIVSLAGMASPAINTLVAQNRRGLTAAGIAGSTLDDSLRLVRLLLEANASRYVSKDSKPVDVDAVASQAGIKLPPEIMSMFRQNAEATSTEWFGAFLNIDPADYLAKVKCPLLAINGTLDTQVDAAENLGIISTLVPEAEVLRMDGLNHLMQHARTGYVSEYGEIRETVAPEVLDALTAFCKAR